MQKQAGVRMEAAQAAGDRFDECMREEWKINAPGGRAWHAS
jgi:hypothetical protein